MVVDNAQSSSQPPNLGTRWHTTTFRWLFAYAGMFAISLVILIGFVDTAASNTTNRDADVVIHWQLIYFDSIPDGQLEEAIDRRLENDRMHTNFYGLFTSDGRHIAGDILTLPRDLSPDGPGRTWKHPLGIVENQGVPVFRVMGERRKDGTQLVVARDLTHVLKIREAVVSTVIGGGLLTLAIGIVGGLMLSMRQMRRVRAIRQVIGRITQGDLHERLPVGGRDEIDLLVHLVNHMLDEVERLMGEVKCACDGIAHDLRTPLAHVRSLLGRIAAYSIATNNDVATRMVAEARVETDTLLERFGAMLRISQIEALQRRGGFATVDLDVLVQELGGLFEPLSETKRIEWVVQSVPAVTIHGDRALLFEAFVNLIDNAIKFAPEGGQVRVELSRTGRGPRLDIVDNGPGIPVDERDAVLKRFYRGDQARQVRGSGLGLSIVSAVLRVHDFTLHIDDARPGARLTVECWPHSLA
ncbi:HAMP domain-containing sensor histidine kinase [Paraburkholderia sp. SIMBA_049]